MQLYYMETETGALHSILIWILEFGDLFNGLPVPLTFPYLFTAKKENNCLSGGSSQLMMTQTDLMVPLFYFRC